LASAPGWVHRIVEGWRFRESSPGIPAKPLSITTTRRTLDSRASINYSRSILRILVGVLPKGIGKVRKGDGFVEYLNGLSTRRAPLPNFGGNTTVAGPLNQSSRRR